MELQQELSKSFRKFRWRSDFNYGMCNPLWQRDILPFTKFFRKGQQKYIKCSSRGIRFNPMTMRFCLSLAAKLTSAYDDIRYDEKSDTGIFILPSRRRLMDYKNYIRPERGFNKHIINELKNKTRTFSYNIFLIILMDEMKIQLNLVWDKHTGELLGYST